MDKDKKLPDGWEKVDLFELARVRTGKRDANHAKPNGKYRFYTCAFDYSWADTKSFSGPSLILPGNGANVGEVFFFDGDFEAYQRTYVIERITVSPKYLYYYFRSYWKSACIKKQYGSATNYIRIGNFKEFNIFTPPLPEQHRIVAKIEELFTQLDKGIEQLEKVQAQLKTYRQAVLKYAFEGKLTEEWRKAHPQPPAEELLEKIKAERLAHYEAALEKWEAEVQQWQADGKPGKKPRKPGKLKEFDPLNENEVGILPENWTKTKLGVIADLVSGVTKGRKLEGKKTIELPYLRVANVQDGYLDLKVIKTIEVLPEDFIKYELKEGDVLYTEGGDKDKLGRGTIWKNEIPQCIHQNHIYRARLIQKYLSPVYTAYYSQTQTAKRYFFSRAKQTVNLASINLTVLGNLPFPVPPLNEQLMIVQEIESRLSVCEKVEQLVEENLLKAEALRQSILKKAFEGKLVPQDPNDEPASELLKRIKGLQEGTKQLKLL